MTILALTGGVGGAKLCLGLARVLSPEEVVFVVNTGDDFEHLGFHISPDVDTLTYTLADAANPVAGWGRQGETWHFMEALDELGGETWFRLGDKDLALHVRRRQLLAAGQSLTAATAHIAQGFGVTHRILPMSDDPVRTLVHTADGPLAFQHYFVRDRCAPEVTGFDFHGAEAARVSPAIPFDQVTGVVICPSNPFVSVDPVLAVPGMCEGIRRSGAPVVAVSPIVGGAAIKGPTAKMMQELGVPATTAEVARHYARRGAGDAPLVTGFVIDAVDAAAEQQVQALGLETTVAQTVMRSLDDRIDLARAVLKFLDAGASKSEAGP